MTVEITVCRERQTDREGQRETETERQRQTDRDRQTDRQTETEVTWSTIMPSQPLRLFQGGREMM